MIGVYDSGIGGVTVLNEIRNTLPDYTYYYFSDSKNNPYGEKSETDILEIVKENIDYLINLGCNPIVIACNTASTICLKKLRKTWSNIVFIGIEPAIKVVYDKSLFGKTIVMATPGTLKSSRFLENFRKYNSGNMKLIPCPNLAALIEKNDTKQIKEYLKENLVEKDIENVVLGCTHYPLIKKEIKGVLGNVNFFDGSKGVSKELTRKLKEYNINLFKERKIIFYDSSHNLQKEKRFFEFLKENNLD